LSVESYGFKFVVDAKDAAKGYGDFQKAVDGVFASLDRFEQHAKKVMDSVTSSSKKGQTDIAKYAAQFKSLASIPIDSRAAPALLKLSDAMARFKAPNTTQITNMRNFFKTMGTIPDVSSATRSIGNIAKLSSALSGFKAPSAGQAEKLVIFSKALQQIGPGLASLSKVAGVSGIANELASVSIALNKLRIPSASQATNLQNFARALQMMRIGGAGGMEGMLRSLASINGFKAPSAAQTRNLVQFVNAINNLKVPANAGQIAEYLQRIASSANLANSSLKGFRGSLNSISWGSFNTGAARARVEMMGLQNAFSGTFQVGSLLRSLLGSLTIAELGRGFFQATQTANQFHAAMMVLGETPLMTSQAWERIRDDANHFGADLNSMAESFSKFSLAAHENGVSLQESFKIFEGFQTVMTATHMGLEQQQSVGLAIREMMDQGYVSTARLTRQLGLVLPGATRTLLDAWKASGSKLTLWDALKKKMVDSQWALDTLSNHYKNVFGPGVKQALESPIQQWNILKNNIMQAMVEIGDSGAKKAFADLIKQISGYMDPTRAHDFAKAIGEAVTKAVNKLSAAIAYLHDHWATIGPILATVIKYMAEWEILMSGLQIGRWITTPLLGIGRALTVLQAVGGAVSVLAARSLPAAAAGTAGLSGAARTGAVSMLALRNNVALAAVALEGEAVAATTLSARLIGLGAAGMTAVGGGLRSLVNLVGGPYVATFMAASYATYQLIQTYDAAQETIDQTNKFLTESKKTVQEATDKIYLHSNALNVATKSGIDFNDCTRGATPFLDAYKAHMDKVTGGLYSMAIAAREATIETLKLQAAQNQGQLANLQVNSSSEVGKKAGELWGQGRYALSIGARIKQGTDAFSSGIGWDASQKDINAQIDAVRRNGDNIQKSLAAAQNKSVMDIVADMKKAGLGAPDRTDPIYHGSDGEGGKKKKGKDPAAALRTQENSISTLMKDLMEDDPYGKLYSEFVDKLTKEGEILLTNKAFKQFIGNMKTDAATGKVSVDALINALQNGGIKGKVLDDLKKRYGTDVNGIIKMLQSQQAAYENSIKEATVKAIKAQNQATNDVLKRLAEDNPLLKITQEYTDDLENEAMKLLNAGSFKAWFEETENGADGAATATQRLVDALRNANNLTPGLEKGLAARGMSVGGTIIPGLQRSDATEKLNYRDKQDELEVGKQLLMQGQQELALASMTNRQQTVANKLLEEFNRQKGLKHIMNQQEIDDLQRNLILQAKQLDLMQQQKDYYENNGIKKYLGDIQTAGEFVHQFDNDALKGLEETLYQLGTTGKLSFKSLVDGLQSDIIRFASQNLVKSFVNLLNPNAANEKDPTMFGFLGKMLGGSTGFTPTNKSLIEESMFTPLNVSVVNGNMAFGGGAFGGGGGAAGGSGSGDGGLFDMILGGSSPTNSPLLDPNKAGSVPGALGDSLTSSITAVQPAIQNSFMTTFKGLAMSLGPLLGGAIGGAVGGKWGGVIGTVASIGMMFLTRGMSGGAGMGGGMGVPGGLEGGITGSLVNRYTVHPSAFIGAPHYAEGTPNTSGGHAAILHDNEAVIPLSRGRKVPVELTGVSSPANGGVTVNNHFNISSPDADSFRKSRSQIATDLHAAGARSWSRNN
jgi:hypothetical protein